MAQNHRIVALANLSVTYSMLLTLANLRVYFFTGSDPMALAPGNLLPASRAPADPLLPQRLTVALAPSLGFSPYRPLFGPRWNLRM